MKIRAYILGLVTLFLAAGPAGRADVIILSSGNPMLGRILHEDSRKISMTIKSGKIEIERNRIICISKSAAAKDTYLDAAHRLSRDKPLMAAICLEQSLAEEPETSRQAQVFLNSLRQRKLTAPKRQVSLSDAQRAVELRRKGEAMIRMGEATRNAGVIDTKNVIDRQKVSKRQIAEGQKLLAEAQQIEAAIHAHQQAKAEAAKQPWKPSAIKRWFRGDTATAVPGRADQQGWKINPVLLWIGAGVVAALGIGYFFIWRP